MRHHAQAPTDPFAVAFRMQTLKTGVWPTVLVCIYASAYYAWTWGGPHRPLLLAIIAGAFVSAVAVALLPMERVIRGRWCEPFFLSWSASLIVMIGVSAALDGGAASPVIPLFFLPLVYVALSYPLPSTLAVGVMNLVAFLLLSATTPETSPQHVFVFACALVSATVICSWQSLNHDRHRRDLDRASRTDPLTGCLNRRGFQERFAAELSRARREGREIALLVLDLDDFKAVNDQHGHAAGDELLCWVAATLADSLRVEDTIGRLGGDEFAAVIIGDPAIPVDRTLEALRRRAPSSAGIAVYPRDGGSTDDLHRVADANLYVAKHGRRDAPAPARELSWAAALAAAVDERMAVRHEHSHAVATLAGAIAERLGWDAPDVERLRLAAVLHDVGKVRVPDQILRKPGPLDADEWREIVRHPVVGAEIVARVEGLETIGPWIRHSHERIDGGGYPDGLRGEDIPLASRILLVADAYDAMTSDRSYRNAIPRREALAELDLHAGTQFDPSCVAALKAHLAHGSEVVA